MTAGPFNGPKRRTIVCKFTSTSSFCHFVLQTLQFHFISKKINNERKKSESLSKLFLLQARVGAVSVCGGEDKRAVAPCRQQLALSSAPASSKVSSTLTPIPLSSHSSKEGLCQCNHVVNAARHIHHLTWNSHLTAEGKLKLAFKTGIIVFPRSASGDSFGPRWTQTQTNTKTQTSPSEWNLFACLTKAESSVLSYSPREELVVSLADAQTASHILPPDKELASICKSNHQA